MRLRRALLVLLVTVISATPPVTTAQVLPDPGAGGPGGITIPRPILTGQCIRPEQGKELYGPTDINAQSGNQGHSVGFNSHGTVTVFKWPSPSYYDQVKYHTNSRDEPRMGALENAGTFLGLALTTPTGTRTVWMRDADVITQHHPAGYTDEVVTTYRLEDAALTVEVTDVVAHPEDVLYRHVDVTRDDDSPVTDAALVVYENMNLVVSKFPALPVQDWCLEGLNTDTATYNSAVDAIVHTKSGIDVSTAQPSSAAVAIGFVEASDQHQVGGDAYEPLALPDGSLPLATQDAYDDADDGQLRGNDRYIGQTTGAMRRPLTFDDGRSTATVLMTAAASADTATDLLQVARTRSVDDALAAKRAWLADLLGGFPRPATDGVDTDDAIQGLVDRALVTLVTDIDRETNAIVASISTQSPYGADWPRDGAFFDLALDLGGLHDLVAGHHAFYANTQQTLEDPDLFLTALTVPPGNWGMNYYADGVVGGPIPWEIDETGYAVWNFWQHHLATGDVDALRTIWPTMQRAADFLTDCADLLNDLQCRAIEDDNPDLRQTLVGAASTWMALEAAAEAAAVLDEQSAAQRYRSRADALAAAIDRELYNGTVYGPGARAEIVWPACFVPEDPDRLSSHYDALWAGLARSFAEPEAGAKTEGLYEAKGLLALAKVWKDDPDGMALIRSGLDWIVTRHANEGTHVMGEVWRNTGEDIISIQGTPHAWEQVLTYLVALEAYPPAGFENVAPGCDGVLGALRDARRNANSTTTAPNSPDEPVAAGRRAPAGAPTGTPSAPTPPPDRPDALARTAALPATGNTAADLVPVALGAASLALLLLSRRRKVDP